MKKPDIMICGHSPAIPTYFPRGGLCAWSWLPRGYSATSQSCSGDPMKEQPETSRWSAHETFLLPLHFITRIFLGILARTSSETCNLPMGTQVASRGKRGTLARDHSCHQGDRPFLATTSIMAGIARQRTTEALRPHLFNRGEDFPGS